MKLKLLFLTLLGSVAIASAQYTVKGADGTVLNDGDIIEYGVYGYNTGASFDFYVTNDNPNETINTRIEVVDAPTPSGIQFELCYAEQCYTDLSIGQTLPAVPDTYPIGVGETTGEGNHFQNNNPGDGSEVLDYVFSFHQYEDDGVTEIGTPLTFTYRYNPALDVKDNTKVNLSIQSTVVSNELVLNVNEPVSLMIYDLQGRVVKQARFETGRQTLNVSNLNSQAYILRFNNENGATQTTKIIVK